MPIGGALTNVPFSGAYRYLKQNEFNLSEEVIEQQLFLPGWLSNGFRPRTSRQCWAHSGMIFRSRGQGWVIVVCVIFYCSRKARLSIGIE